MTRPRGAGQGGVLENLIGADALKLPGLSTVPEFLHSAAPGAVSKVNVDCGTQPELLLVPLATTSPSPVPWHRCLLYCGTGARTLET